MYLYGVCSSYTEYRRIKKSAAQSAVADLNMSGISHATDGLVQGIVDNLDANRASQNGKQSTHSITCSPSHSLFPDTISEEEKEASSRIRRVPNNFSDVPYDVEIHRYQGSKQPQMPKSHAVKGVTTLRSLFEHVIVNRRAAEVNIKKNDCPEYHGYNTRESRATLHNQRQKKYIYPLST